MPRGRHSRQRRRGGRVPERREIYPLPQDTGVLAEVRGERCLNYGLRTERLLKCDRDSWELAKPTRERRGVREFNQGDLSRLISAHKARWETMLNDCQQHNYIVRQFLMRAEGRVIIGLGAESVLETSIHLHRTYGFPIIPGSALKGLARSYALWQVAEQLGVLALSPDEVAARERSRQPSPIQKLEAYINEPDENRRSKLLNDLQCDEAVPSSVPVRQMNLSTVEEKVKPIRDVFGTIAGTGKVIFFDAIPANSANLKLDLDVMNPHYSQYYQGGDTPPADYLNPIPVFFLTIAPGSEFLFAVASKDVKLAQQAQNWLTAGLTEMGVGAKTVAGYGYFTQVIPGSSAHAKQDVGASPVASQSKSLSPVEKVPEIRAVQLMPVNQVASQIRQYYEAWKKLSDEEARRILAEAILEKLRQAKKLKDWKDKEWVKELQEFVARFDSTE